MDRSFYEMFEFFTAGAAQISKEISEEELNKFAKSLIYWLSTQKRSNGEIMYVLLAVIAVMYDSFKGFHDSIGIKNVSVS